MNGNDDDDEDESVMRQVRGQMMYSSLIAQNPYRLIPLRLPVCLSVCLFVCLSVCLSVCLFVFLSICLSVSALVIYIVLPLYELSISDLERTVLRFMYNNLKGKMNAQLAKIRFEVENSLNPNTCLQILCFVVSCYVLSCRLLSWSWSFSWSWPCLVLTYNVSFSNPLSILESSAFSSVTHASFSLSISL